MGRLVFGAAGDDTGCSCGERSGVVVDSVLIMVHGLNVGCLVAVLMLLLLLQLTKAGISVGVEGRREITFTWTG